MLAEATDSEEEKTRRREEEESSEEEEELDDEVGGIFFLTNFKLNKLPHTIYWKSRISIILGVFTKWLNQLQTEKNVT